MNMQLDRRTEALMPLAMYRHGQQKGPSLNTTRAQETLCHCLVYKLTALCDGFTGEVWRPCAIGLPACTDVALEPDLAELELQVGVVQGHDVGVLLAQGAVAAWGGLLPALALPQVQPAPCHARKLSVLCLCL